MRTNINEDIKYVELKEAWMANESELEETASDLDKQMYFTPNQVIDVKGKGIKFHALVKDENGQDAYIDLIVPNAYIRDEGDKQRISSNYITRAKANFNKGLYATGGIDTTTGYQPNKDNKPKFKIKNIQLLPKGKILPRYSKHGDTIVQNPLVDNGVKINPQSEAKRAIITNSRGEAVIVKINEENNYLIGFEMRDEHDSTIRVDSDSDAVIVAVMPVPISKIDESGFIDLEYVREFVAKWNSGQRYIWDGQHGKIDKDPNAKGNPLSVDELSNKLINLDRFKPKFKNDDVGTQGAEPQRHRLQNVAQKKQIEDKDIAEAEKAKGKKFTKEEFIEFIKDKGIIPPDALRKDEFGKKLLRRWAQRNPRLASYIKYQKENRAERGKFQTIDKIQNLDTIQADKDRYETPEQGKDRMAQAHDAEEIVIDDNDLADVPDNIWASSGV